MTLSNVTSVGILVGITLPLTLLAVGLRFVARIRTNTNYGWDDWFALLALAMSIVYQGLAMYCGVKQGAPTSLTEIPFANLEAFLKGDYAAELFIPPVFLFSKLSILCLYSRVFQSDSRFKLWIKILFTVNIAWCIAAVVSLIFKCTPIAKAWNLLLPGHCINFNFYTPFIEIPNSLMDFIMMVLPFNSLRKLQMSFKVKASIAFIFLLGGSVGIIGFVRIAAVYNPQSVSLDTDGIILTAQQAAAVICCCLPTYRPLFRKVKLLAIIRTRYASILRRTAGGSGGSGRSGRSRRNNNAEHFAMRETIGGRKYNRFDSAGNVAKDEGWVLTRSEGVIKSNTNYKEAGSYPLAAINVERTVDMV